MKVSAVVDYLFVNYIINVENCTLVWDPEVILGVTWTFRQASLFFVYIFTLIT